MLVYVRVTAWGQLRACVCIQHVCVQGSARVQLRVVCTRVRLCTWFRHMRSVYACDLSLCDGVPPVCDHVRVVTRAHDRVNVIGRACLCVVTCDRVPAPSALRPPPDGQVR